MANQPKNILGRQLMSVSDLSGATPEALEKLRNSPEFAKLQKTVRDGKVHAMQYQFPECGAAKFQVTRKNTSVTIEWKIRYRENYHGTVDVSGSIDEIGYDTDSKELQSGLIATTKGDGNVSLELEEGGVYLFYFTFINKNISIEDDPAGYYQTIYFQVGIPLSDERKAFLRRNPKVRGTPAEQLRQEFEDLVETKNAFYEMRKKALDRIKAMNLSPEDERREIENFNDEAERIKDNYGM